MLEQQRYFGNNIKSWKNIEIPFFSLKSVNYALTKQLLLRVVSKVENGSRFGWLSIFR